MKKLLISIVVLGVAGLGWFLFVHLHGNVPTQTTGATAEAESFMTAPGFAADDSSSTESTSAPSVPPRTPPAGQKEYRSEHYRFAFFYPSDFAVHEYDEGGGASTITIQNVTKSQGFQIFVVPYGAHQVSVARFKKDEPSGVMQEPQNIKIDGALATLFFGQSSTLGDTREVWFIHGGYLFEVTTFKPLDAWLAGIMQSWMFI